MARGCTRDLFDALPAQCWQGEHHIINHMEVLRKIQNNLHGEV
jgi:hypothetical protein